MCNRPALFNRNLPSNKKSRAPNPIVTLQVSGESAQSSEADFSSHNPVFEQEFVFKITSALSDNLTLKVNTDVQIVGVTDNKSFINDIRNT